MKKDSDIMPVKLDKEKGVDMICRIDKKVENFIVIKQGDKQATFQIKDFSNAELAELKKVLFSQLHEPDVNIDTEVVCEFLRKINEELQNRVNVKFCAYCQRPRML